MTNYKADSVVSTYDSYSITKWLIWLCAGIFYLYELVLRVSPSVMAHELMEEFQITATTFGLLASCYYWAYVPLQIPCGILVDKFGPKLVVVVSCALCTLGALIFAYSNNFALTLLARFLIGAGSACAFISCLKLASEWFSMHYFAMMAGLTNMLGTLGGTFGGPPLAKMVNHFGWRDTIAISAYLGVGLTIACALIIKNKPSVSIYPANSYEPTDSLKKALKVLLMNKQIILAGLVGGLMYLPVTAFAELWAVPFLMRSFAIDNQLASTISVMVFIGMAIGSPIMAKYASRINSIKKTMQHSAAIAGLLFIGITYVGYMSISTAFVLCFAVGTIIGAQVLCFTMVKVRVPSDISGTAMAFTNTIVMFVGMIFQPLLGKILDWSWSGQVDANNVRIYTIENYQTALFCLPLCLLVCYFLLRWYQEKTIND